MQRGGKSVAFDEPSLLAPEHPASRPLPGVRGVLIAGGLALLFSILAVALLIHAATAKFPPGDFQDHLILMPLAFVLLAPMMSS